MKKLFLFFFGMLLFLTTFAIGGKSTAVFDQSHAVFRQQSESQNTVVFSSDYVVPYYKFDIKYQKNDEHSSILMGIFAVPYRNIKCTNWCIHAYNRDTHILKLNSRAILNTPYANFIRIYLS